MYIVPSEYPQYVWYGIGTCTNNSELGYRMLLLKSAGRLNRRVWPTRFGTCFREKALRIQPEMIDMMCSNQSLTCDYFSVSVMYPSLQYDDIESWECWVVLRSR
jgi:hypothetical protein